LFSALWTRETYQATILTLASAAVAGRGFAPAPSGSAAQCPVAGPITGFTKHGLSRVMERGISPGQISAAVRDAKEIIVRTDELGRTSYRYVSDKAIVVLNEAGKVITAWLK
jgi:hypothetical protein